MNAKSLFDALREIKRLRNMAAFMTSDEVYTTTRDVAEKIEAFIVLNRIQNPESE